MSKPKPLKITITTQNATPVIAEERVRRHQLWLDFCNKLEQELGPCNSQELAQVYQQRLEAFDKSLGFSLSITVNWPSSYTAFKQLCSRLGSDVLAVEVDHNSKSLIGVVYVNDK